jgi:hypothetical protein
VWRLLPLTSVSTSRSSSLKVSDQDEKKGPVCGIASLVGPHVERSEDEVYESPSAASR